MIPPLALPTRIFWRIGGRGARLSTCFPPLANEPPPPADMIILPGGYPELHAGRLAANTTFMDGIRNANTPVYGECGGYMVMGRGLIDAHGVRHAMAGLLDLETSFATPTRHLGYRRLGLLGDGVWRAVADGFMAHEFHYASTISAAGDPLFHRDHGRWHCPAAHGFAKRGALWKFCPYH